MCVNLFKELLVLILCKVVNLYFTGLVQRAITLTWVTQCFHLWHKSYIRLQQPTYHR